MISLGILTLHPYARSEYANHIGKQSRKFQIQVYHFHPTSWNEHTNLVNGYRFDHEANDWKPELFTLPTFIYDRCYYTDPTQSQAFSIVQKLKKRAFFLSAGLPNKWKVYNVLAREPSIAPFLPKTIKITTFNTIVQSLLKWQKIVLKPSSGSHGKGIFFIELIRSNHVFIQTHYNGKKIAKTVSLKAFRTWFQSSQLKNRYILQPFLHLLNTKKEPFDIRILVQKNELGQWREVGRGIRVGKRGNYVSNLHNGGKVQPFSERFQRNRKLNDQLEQLVTNLPYVLDEHFHPLFELGIDIGIDPTGTCWLLEVNSKPGYRTILPTVNIDELSEHPLHYCLYLRKELFKREIDRAGDPTQKNVPFIWQTTPSANLF